MTRGRRRAPWSLALLLAAGCTATRPAPPLPECAAVAATSPLAATCDRDAGVRSVQARFRAEVEAGGSTRTAEGVLVWRAPGALRVKLFTLAGLTVYDALWVGDAGRLRGVVRQPLAGRDDAFDLGPGEGVASPEADLSLVLWSLWAPRCARAPEPHGGDGFTLDPEHARAAARVVEVRDGAVRTETVTRRRTTDGTLETVVARYAEYDCGAPPLPRRVAIEAPQSGWRARVTIVDQARDVTLDDALFAVPAAPGSHGGG